MSEQTLVAIIGCIAVLVLMLIRVPIAVSLGSVAVAGFAYLVGPQPALGILIDSPIRTVTNFNFSVIPMFILMGALVSASGMSRELFRAANAWVGHLPGGMAIATIFACGGFAAISGSSIASAATMTQVALPEMRRAGYDPGLSAGVVAAGGTLDIMIPPSVMFVLYAILTETDLVGAVHRRHHSRADRHRAVLHHHPDHLQVRTEWLPRGKRSDRLSDWPASRTSGRHCYCLALSSAAFTAASSPSRKRRELGVFGALVIGVARGRLSWLERSTVSSKRCAPRRRFSSS